MFAARGGTLLSRQARDDENSSPQLQLDTLALAATGTTARACVQPATHQVVICTRTAAWIVRLALRRPYTFVVPALLTVLTGVLTSRRDRFVSL